MLYLGVTLIDAGRYQDAVNEMLDAAADAHLTGLDRSFGGYLDALAAEGLLRLGRWSEAEAVLERSDGAADVASRQDPTRPQRRHARRPTRRPGARRLVARRRGAGTGRSVSPIVPRRRSGRCAHRPRRLGPGGSDRRARPQRRRERRPVVADPVRDVRR